MKVTLHLGLIDATIFVVNSIYALDLFEIYSIRLPCAYDLVRLYKLQVQKDKH